MNDKKEFISWVLARVLRYICTWLVALRANGFDFPISYVQITSVPVNYAMLPRSIKSIQQHKKAKVVAATNRHREHVAQLGKLPNQARGGQEAILHGTQEMSSTLDLMEPPYKRHFQTL